MCAEERVVGVTFDIVMRCTSLNFLVLLLVRSCYLLDTAA